MSNKIKHAPVPRRHSTAGRLALRVREAQRSAREAAQATLQGAQREADQ